MERQYLKRGLNRLLLMPIALSVVYAGVLIWQLSRMLSAAAWVEHTSIVLIRANETSRHIQFQESALRGYLLSPRPIFQQQFYRSEQTVDSLLQQLHVLVVDNPRQLQRLDSLMHIYWVWEASARQWLQAANPTSAVRFDPAELDSALIFRTRATDEMQQQFRAFTSQETELYALRTRHVQHGTLLLILLITGASVLVGLFVGFNARRQVRQFSRRFTNALDEAERNRDLLRTTLLSIDDAIIVTDLAGTITLMNARAESLTGWLNQAALAHPIAEVFRVRMELDGTPVEDAVESVLQNQKSFQPKSGLTLQSKLRVEYPIELSIIPVYGAENVVAGTVVIFRDISELRENQRQADLREQEFRALLENTPDVIIRYGPDLSILYANPAVESMLGVLPAVLVGRSFQDIGIEEATGEAWRASIRAVFAAGRPTTTELEYPTVRGMRRYHLRLVPERVGESNSGATRIHSVISIARDVTELKQTEQRLRESEQRFRGIVENSPDAFFLLRTVRKGAGDKSIVDFLIEYVNMRAADLLSSDTTDLPGRKLSEVLTAENTAETITKYADILKSGVPAHEEFRVQPSDAGRPRWLHAQYVPLAGERLAVTTSDVTSRMQILLALERSEARYRELVENASEAIFSTDPEGRFSYANPYVRELGGYGDADVSQFRFTDLLPDDQQERVKRHFFRQLLAKAPSSYIEAPFRRPDGTNVWLAIKSRLQIHSGEVLGFDCIATDITERKRMESELEQVRSQAGGSAHT